MSEPRENLQDALIRASAIIEWMAPYLPRMCPPPNGLYNLNEHFLYMEKLGLKTRTNVDDDRRISEAFWNGRPLGQRGPDV